ncbi:uncharacterized protein LOC143521917 [Brachyhypopomus gauderio]|uniref:uncharacterized protein LOC143521917 n=1 Tax=Brachyhypopomus gauderio TaxID=698409 RepID=UPI0040417F84
MSGSADQPMSGSADQTMPGSTDQTPSGSIDQTPSGSIDQTPSGSIDQTPSGSADQTTAGSTDQTTSAPSAAAIDDKGYSCSQQRQLFVNMAEFFAPKYNYDFRNLPAEMANANRGGEMYMRPYGWYRCALKVLDKYEDGNGWLGSFGWRDQSDPGEWPVSYHGTSKEAAEKIIASHYKAGEGQAYGHGIYSTPNISEAEQNYAREFTNAGKKYKVILQNRINPEVREVCNRQDYWLIPVPHDADPQLAKKIVESAIRPYGLLIKELINH